MKIYQIWDLLWAEMSQLRWSLAVALVFGLSTAWLYTCLREERVLEGRGATLGVGFGLLVLILQEIPYIGVFYKMAYTIGATLILLVSVWRILRHTVHAGSHWVH